MEKGAWKRHKEDVERHLEAVLDVGGSQGAFRGGKKKERFANA